MMYKEGLVFYYGASIITNFAEYVKINDHTLQMIRDTHCTRLVYLTVFDKAAFDVGEKLSISCERDKLTDKEIISSTHICAILYNKIDL